MMTLQEIKTKIRDLSLLREQVWAEYKERSKRKFDPYGPEALNKLRDRAYKISKEIGELFKLYPKAIKREYGRS